MKPRRGLKGGKGGIAHPSGVQYGKQVNVGANTSARIPGKGRKKRTMTDMAKVSVTFSQKISEQAYETSDYSLTIERSVPESMGEDGIIAEADNMFSQAKAEVLKQAGQDFDVSDTGVVMRKLKSAVSEPSGSARQ